MQSWLGHKLKNRKKILNIVRSMNLLTNGMELHLVCQLVYNKILSCIQRVNFLLKGQEEASAACIASISLQFRSKEKRNESQRLREKWHK